MPGGCWVCNPLCGKCQPPPKKSGHCPECGACTLFDRDEILGGGSLACRSCGHDLTLSVRPQPIQCNYSGMACAYPCGKGRGETPTLGYQTCKRNTPLTTEL